jgi:hypothetical protein
MGGNSYEFGDAKTHGIAEKSERDGHSIVSGGDRNRLAGQHSGSRVAQQRRGLPFWLAGSCYE